MDATTQAFHRHLCESAGIALIGIDPSVRISYWNSAAARIFGADARAMVGAPFVSVMPNERRDLAQRLVTRAIDRSAVSQFQFSHRDPQGRLRDLAVIVSPIADDGGNTIGASACIRDVTRRIQLQKEVNRARKLSSMGEMAGALSHHFNNILGGIVTSVDFALASHDPALHKQALKATAESLTRATRLMEGLLAFAEGLHKELDLADIREIVYSFLEAMEESLKNAKVEAVLNIASIPVSPVPRGPVAAILFHLTKNAVESMPDGGVLRLDVDRTGDSLVMKLADMGCGISTEDMQRIFEPFFSTKRGNRIDEQKNPGLGLAIVHGILRDIGGTVTVDSTVGAGTLVTATLPVHTDEKMQ